MTTQYAAFEVDFYFFVSPTQSRNCSPGGGSTAIPPDQTTASGYIQQATYTYTANPAAGYSLVDGVWLSTSSLEVALARDSDVVAMDDWTCPLLLNQNLPESKSSGRFRPVTGASVGISLPEDEGDFLSASDTFAEFMTWQVVSGPYCVGIGAGILVVNIDLDVIPIASAPGVLADAVITFDGNPCTVVGTFTREEELNLLDWQENIVVTNCPKALWVLVSYDDSGGGGGGGDEFFTAQLIGSIGPFTLLARAATPQPCPVVGRLAESCVEGFSSVPPGVRQIVSGRDDVLTHCDHGHVRPARGIASGVGEALGYAYAFSEGVAEADSIGIALGISDFAHAIDARGDATGTGTAFAVGSSIAAALAEAAGIGDASGISSAIATIEAIGAADGIGTADAIGYSVAAALAAAAGTGEALAIGEAVTGTTIISAVAVAAGVGGSVFDDEQAIVEAVAAAAAIGDAFATSQASVTVSAHGDAQGLGLAQAIGRSTVAAVATAAGIGDAQSYSDTIATIESVGSSDGIGVAAATALSTVAGDGAAAGIGEALGIGAIAIQISAAVAAASGTGAAAGISAGSVSQAVAAAIGTGAANARGNAIIAALAAAQGAGLATGISFPATISAAVGQADGVSSANATGRSIAGAAGAAQGLGAAQARPVATISAVASASAHGTAAGIGSDGGAIVINPGCNLISDTVIRTIPTHAKPAYLGSYIDPTYGTLVTRISGDPGTPIPVVGGTWPTEIRNGYNKRQPWNCDESILFIEVGGLLLDGQTYHVIATNASRGKPSGEVRWHPTNPALMYNTSGNVFQTWNVNTGTKTVLHTFTGYSGMSIGNGEGNISLDGKWIGISATRTSDGHAVIFAYDISSNTKHPDIDTTAILGAAADAFLSPLHNYLVAGWAGNYAIFTPDGTHITTWPENSKPSHADMAVDENGDEVLVGICKVPPPNTGLMIKRRLRDGVSTALYTSGGWVSHTSCRDTNLTVPWAFGTHQDPSGRSLYDGELTAVALDGSKVFRLCFHHDLDLDYPSEVHAVASPSGTRVCFASNWHDSSGRPVQAYVVDLRTVCAV